MKQAVMAFVAGVVCTLALVAPRPAAQAQTQFEMNQEEAKNYARADAELNRVYFTLAKKLDKPGFAKLQKSQRAWLAFRDAEMAFAADSARGGSMSPMLYSATGAHLTKERTKDLKQHMEEYGVR